MTEIPRPPRSSSIRLFTIGFAGKSAQTFFETLRQAEVKQVVDIRLRNESQLAGYTKKSDLPYLLKAIAGIEYRHELSLAPTGEILDDSRKKHAGWDEYKRRFEDLLRERQPIRSLTPDQFDRACLLCSEPSPDHCHRRLVAEYLRREWGSVEITHL